jgi:hypothetical protein
MLLDWQSEPEPESPALHRCELAHAAGLEETCPGESCALFELGAGCVIGGLRPELAGNPELVSVLLALRERLGSSSCQHPLSLPGMDA